MKRIKYEDMLRIENISILKEAIFQDEAIVYPTDTLYGLGGNFFSLEALEKIDNLKDRKDAPYSIIVSGLEMVKTLVDFIPDIFYILYRRFLPGKFTFLFKAAKKVNPKLLKGSSKIGIRIPNKPNIVKLVELFNTPLISTSVNRTGEAPLNNPETIRKHFSSLPFTQPPSIIIDGGILLDSKGSTILDITKSPIECLRKGDDFDKVSSYLNLN